MDYMDYMDYLGHTRARGKSPDITYRNDREGPCSPCSPWAPTLDAYVTESGIHASVWCAWCRRWHHHGHVTPDAPLGHGDGHRAAHCHEKQSPYHTRGYYIREVGWWPQRPRWRDLPVICRPCGEPFFRQTTAQRYCCSQRQAA